jgi:uncharacterized protein YndB with AHSA1/START domain
MDKPRFVYVTYIATTPERLWEALTNGDFTKRYWGGLQVESAWTVGASVRHLRPDGGVGLQGEVLECDPPRLLVYTFQMQISEERRRERPSRLRFEIEPIRDVVKLTLTHDEFESGSAAFQDTSHGWPAIMSSLKSLLERGEPLPFTGFGFAPSIPVAKRGTL